MKPRLYAELKANSALMAAIAGGLFQGDKPQGAAYPCMSFADVSTQWPAQSHSGPGDLLWSRVSFVAWGKSPAQTEAAIRALIGALAAIDLTRAVTSPATVQTVLRHPILFKGGPEEWAEPEPKIYRQMFDVKIYFKEF